jgi:potassium uptake TrkH family protein
VHLDNPAEVVVVAFAAAVTVSTLLLLLPFADAQGGGVGFRVALFTATSAICVTGLTVVDTAEQWSTFGELVILVSMQVGGFGIMTLATLLGLLVWRRLGLRSRLVAQAETKSLDISDVGRVVRGVAAATLAVEAVVAAMLALRLWLAYDEGAGRAAYLGVFHSVSAFNQGGFALWSDSLARFVTDPWICLPIAGGIIFGSVGFPVLIELRRELRVPRLWSLHTKITLLGTALLLGGGTLFITVAEWHNPATLGTLSTPGKMLAGFFQAVTPRSGGLTTIDYSAMNEETWLITDVLMFIGGGSASTAGGIKVTTFMVLFFAIVAEVRGDATVDAFRRRIPDAAVRQSIAVALLGVAIIVTSTLAMLAITGLDLDRVLFEVISAFGTVGLSTGITADLPAAAHYLLIALMFIGRTGTITVATALVLRENRKLYRLPEERPIVG